MGGQNHPFHQPTSAQWILGNGKLVKEYSAIAGTSHMMTWETWNEYGPQVETQPGVGASEDFEYCQRIRKAGYRVGAIWPAVIIDTGITQTGDTPSPGADIKAKNKVPGVVYL